MKNFITSMLGALVALVVFATGAVLLFIGFIGAIGFMGVIGCILDGLAKRAAVPSGANFSGQFLADPRCPNV